MNSGALQPVVTPIVGAVNAVANAASNAVKAVNNAASGAVVAATNQATNTFNSLPSFNSLIPIGNAPKNNSAKAPNNGAAKNNSASGASSFLGSLFPSANAFASATPPSTANNVANTSANNKANNNANKYGNANAGVPGNSTAGSFMSSYPMIYSLGIFVFLVGAFVAILAVFHDDIVKGYEYALSSFKRSVGVSSPTSVVAATPLPSMSNQVLIPPVPPQHVTPMEQHMQQNIVERVLPSATGNEVFNVADNKFTFYDAEPLCKALGAELATYEQVKDAWGKGADWCNYGWVKGQMAVYPTQQETYGKLQTGPADQQNVCGTTGINGGYFDNPDMKYGVNCYGKKPSQSGHDQKLLMEEGKIPTSPDAIKVNELVAEFRAEADSLFVKPFSKQKWASS